MAKLLKKMVKKFRPIFHAGIPPLACTYSLIVGHTTHLTIIAPPEYDTRKKVLTKKGIYCSWHSRFFYYSYFAKGSNTICMISPSRDGEFIARIVRKLRMLTVRGSSNRRGKLALAEMAETMWRNKRTFMIGDGPRGPRYKLKAGVVRLAQLTGEPILPVSFSSNRGKFLPSWDHFFVPFPFAKAAFVVDDPIWVPGNISEQEFEKIRLQVEQAMERTRLEADRLCGRNSDREIENRKQKK